MPPPSGRLTPADANAWWCVDLERLVTISSVKLTFPFDGNWRYRVEISDDGNSGWRLLSDQSQNPAGTSTQTLSAMAGARGRFLRVTFVGTPDARPAALSEVEALGNFSGQ